MKELLIKDIFFFFSLQPCNSFVRNIEIWKIIKRAITSQSELFVSFLWLEIMGSNIIYSTCLHYTNCICYRGKFQFFILNHLSDFFSGQDHIFNNINQHTVTSFEQRCKYVALTSFDHFINNSNTPIHTFSFFRYCN